MESLGRHGQGLEFSTGNVCGERLVQKRKYSMVCEVEEEGRMENWKDESMAGWEKREEGELD